MGEALVRRGRAAPTREPARMTISPSLDSESAVAGPGWRTQAPGRLPQQQRGRQTESQHYQAQPAQAPPEPGRGALDLGEAAQDRAGLLLKGRSAQAALLVIVGDAIR